VQASSGARCSAGQQLRGEQQDKRGREANGGKGRPTAKDRE